MGNLEKRNKIEMIILVLSINEEAKMKRILCFLLLIVSLTAAEWELKEYVTYGKSFKDELMGVKVSENGNTIVVFKDVFLFYYVRDYDLRTDKPFEILLIGMDDKKSVSIKGTANNEYYNQYVSFITWNTSTKELFKNNKKIMLLLPEEKGIKVEFETADFEKIEGKISKTSWEKIQEFETKYEQEN